MRTLSLNIFLNKIAASNYYTVIHDRKSEVQDVSVSESIYILRCLGDNESWAKEISEHCVKVIKRVNENLSNGFVYIDGFEDRYSKSTICYTCPWWIRGVDTCWGSCCIN